MTPLACRPLARRALAAALATAFCTALVLPAAHGAAPAAKAGAPKAYELTQQAAAARAQRVSNIAYVLDMSLTGKDTFAGATTISFDLRDTASALALDLDKAAIAHLSVNGKDVVPAYNQAVISIAAKHLRRGRNTVVVAYQRAHSTNGEGLHRMQDPADGKVYLYSQFEAFAARQMFALFDQPDMKATFQMNVVAPADWQVVSTMRESGVQDTPDGKRWVFPVTRKIPSYVFSLHAGPYKVWEDNSGPHPMRLFARQSVAAQVRPADWFRYTKAGLVFFEDYFGIPYPFAKYDQLLVPDFLFGAMENAGAVTFAEQHFMYRAEMTQAQRQSLAEVIMHEMAHQWFGNLVTMKWWNGLWLNESFASFMGTHATENATEFKNAWQSFYSTEKQRAYTKDQSPSTHPVEAPVSSTGAIHANLDEITYFKGQSALQQLRKLLGDEVFRKGVRDYLLKYQYGNARLEDFIGSLGAAAGRDLSGWSAQWLASAGVNTIEARYSCAGGKVDKFELVQRAASAALPTLREQRVQVATYHLRGDQVALGKSVPVTYAGASTAVPALVGSACPDLVYPNYQDWGYVKVQLDARSFASARTAVSKIADPLQRAMLWQALWDGVRDGALPLPAFIDTAINNAPLESDYDLLGQVLSMTQEAQGYLDLGKAAPATVARTAAALEAMAWAGVEASRANPNFQRRWFTAYVATARSPDALARLAGLLDGSVVTPGMTIDQDTRWSLIARLNRFAYPGSAALVDAELKRDGSDAGQSAAIAARVSRPEAAVKAQWLATIHDLKSPLPFSKVRMAMSRLYPSEQTALSDATAAERLRHLGASDKVENEVYMRSYRALIPATCSPASVKRLDGALQARTLSVTMRRALQDARAEDQRCMTIARTLEAKGQ